jgi:hypothetical protein
MLWTSEKRSREATGFKPELPRSSRGYARRRPGRSSDNLSDTITVIELREITIALTSPSLNIESGPQRNLENTWFPGMNFNEKPSIGPEQSMKGK